MHQEQEKLLERESFLNQREEFLFKRLEELSALEKQLESVKQKIELEQKTLREERSNFDLDIRALVTREEVCSYSFNLMYHFADVDIVLWVLAVHLRERNSD